MEDSSQSDPNKVETHSAQMALSKLEWFGTQLDIIRFWFTRAWRIGMLLAKGGYLLSERKKLFKQLGQETFYNIQKGDLSLTELNPLVQEIRNLTKKIEIEELLIRRLRFGTSYKRELNPQEAEEPTAMS